MLLRHGSSLSNNELHSIRLQLNEHPQSFEIQEWEYSPGKIEIQPVTVEGHSSWLGPMSGTVFGRTMTLERKETDWTLILYLRGEEELLEEWRALKEEMQ